MPAAGGLRRIGVGTGVRLMLALLWALPGLTLAAVPLHLDTAGLTPAQVAASQALLADAQAQLTPRMRSLLAGSMQVRWSDLPQPHTPQRSTPRQLSLDRGLLPPHAPPPSTGTHADTSPALAALLHALAHQVDEAMPGGAMSEDPYLLELAGWQARATPVLTTLLGHRSDNTLRDRSLGYGELSDQREYVAVNLVHFLLDADYACRRPALYRYFVQRLGEPMQQARPVCPVDFPYVDAGDLSDGSTGGGALGVLDPERIYQVDYLLAEGNHALMSRWGHSMLRLVICAPGHPRGPACRLDLQYHRVVSFRAFVGDVQISNWRGLTGGYPSRLFVLPLNQVIDEYTQVELRGLQSLGGF